MSGKRSVLALIGALLAFGYVFTMNPGAVEFKLYPGKAVKTSLALVLFLFFLAGFGAAVFITAFKEALRSFAFWRHRRADERRDEARRLLAQGRGHAVLGQTKAAHKVLRRAYRKAAGEILVAIEMARVEIADGRLDDAERHLKNLLHDHPTDPEVLSLLLDLYRRRGDFDRQAATLTRWLELDPGHQPALRALRDLYRGAGNWSEAARVQERVTAGAEGRAARTEARRTLAELRCREAGQQAPEVARKTLEQVLRDEDGVSPVHLALGEALWAAGDRDGAVQAWLRGYNATGQAGLLLRLEEARVGEGKGDEVLKLYRKLGKKGGVPVLLRARLLLGLERPREALELLEGDGVAEAETPLGRLLLGEALYRARSFDGAAEAFRRAAVGTAADVPLGFGCSHCGGRSRGWSPSCPACGSFDTLGLDSGALPPPAALPARA